MRQRTSNPFHVGSNPAGGAEELEMGTDYHVCSHCNETFYYDEEDIVACGDDCNRWWCNPKCAVEDGYRFEDEASCNYCRGEEAEDTDLFKFLLKKYNLNRGTVLKQYLEQKERT